MALTAPAVSVGVEAVGVASGVVDLPRPRHGRWCKAGTNATLPTPAAAFRQPLPISTAGAGDVLTTEVVVGWTDEGLVPTLAVVAVASEDSAPADGRLSSGRHPPAVTAAMRLTRLTRSARRATT